MSELGFDLLSRGGIASGVHDGQLLSPQTKLQVQRVREGVKVQCVNSRRFFGRYQQGRSPELFPARAKVLGCMAHSIIM